MKTYIVNLYITSPDRKLDELSAIVGRESGVHSSEVGSFRGLPEKGRRWDYTTWKLESPLPSESELSDHLQYIADESQTLQLDEIELLFDVTVELDIAVFFDTALATVKIDSHWTNFFGAKGIALEISCYPKWEFLDK
jgi:hypothetical protein